jgi:hypothetical protein
MKRARVYVVERKCFRTWNPIADGQFRYLMFAKTLCRILAQDLPRFDYRVMAYDRADARPLLVVKGDPDD